MALCAACGDDEPGSADAGEDAGTSVPDAERPDDAGRDGARDMDGAIEGDGSMPDADAGADAGPGGTFPLAGRRLVPTGYAAGDMLDVRDIYDRELQTRCGFWKTSEPGAQETTYHCVPLEYGEVRYTDDTCSEEVVRVRERGACAGGSRPPIVQAMHVSSCGQLTMQPRRLDLDAPIELDTVYQRVSGTGACEAEAVEDAEVFAILPDPLSALVSATIETVPTAQPGLDVDVYVGDDGSVLRSELRLQDGERCQLHPLGPDSSDHSCLPDALFASDNTYADDACTEPVFTGTVSGTLACPQDEPEWRWGITYAEIDGCMYVDALYALGDAVSELYSDGSDCTPFERPEDWRSFTATEERPLSELPTLTIAPVGSERLQLEHFTAQDGSALFQAWSWWDSEAQRACDPRPFADGSVRCVRIDYVPHEGFFADDACTVPAYTTLVGGCNPAADEPRIRAERDDAACGSPITRLFQLEEHEGDVYSDSDGCMPATLPDGQAAFVDGDELDAESFAELEVVDR